MSERDAPWPERSEKRHVQEHLWTREDLGCFLRKSRIVKWRIRRRRRKRRRGRERKRRSHSGGRRERKDTVTVVWTLFRCSPVRIAGVSPPYRGIAPLTETDRADISWKKLRWRRPTSIEGKERKVKKAGKEEEKKEKGKERKEI